MTASLSDVASLAPLRRAPPTYATYKTGVNGTNGQYVTREVSATAPRRARDRTDDDRPALRAGD